MSVKQANAESKGYMTETVGAYGFGRLRIKQNKSCVSSSLQSGPKVHSAAKEPGSNHASLQFDEEREQHNQGHEAPS